MRKQIFFTLILISFFFSNAFCKVITVQAKIDSTSLRIGEQTTLHLDLVQDNKEKVLFPTIADSLISGVEVVSVSKPDTFNMEDGRLRIRKDLIITAFDSALYYIPPFKFVSGTDTVETNSLTLKVFSLPVDTVKKQLFDIKTVYNAKINWVEVITKSLVGLLIIGLLVFLFLYWRKQRKIKQGIVEYKKPKIPPHELALKELDRIKNEKLWQQARLKEYYTDLTNVLRQYLELRYGIHALELTTDEIMERLDDLKNIDKESKSKIEQVFRLADLVKFAKWVPDMNENDLILNNSYLFVNQTKEVAQIIEEAEKEVE